MADFIAGLNPNDPPYNDPVRQAASQVRGIKKALLGSFPTFSEALDIGPDELNAFETRIAALEAAFVLAPRKIESGVIDMTDALASYVVTGLGFQPSFLIMTGNQTDEISGVGSANGTFGFADGTQKHSVTYASDGNNRSGNDISLGDSNLLWQLYGAQGAAPPNDLAHTGIFTSFDVDGFTVNATKVAPASDFNRLLWTAFE